MDEVQQKIISALQAANGALPWEQVIGLLDARQKQHVHEIFRGLERQEVCHRFVGRDESGNVTLTIREGAKPDTTPPSQRNQAVG